MYTKLSMAVALLALLLPLAAEATRTTAENRVRSGNEAYFDGDYPAAAAHFTAAIAADGAWAVPFNNRGLAYCRQALFAQGRQDFDDAKLRASTYAAPYLNQGKCLAAQKRFTEAAAELEAGLSIEPLDKKLLYNLAWVKDELEKYDEAIDFYDQALAVDPDYANALAGRAVALAKSGDAGEAVAAFYDRINAGNQGTDSLARIYRDLAMSGDRVDGMAGLAPGDAPPHKTAAGGDVGTAIAAYNLQLLRGPGLAFPSEASAESYADGIFFLSVGHYDTAVDKLELAQAQAPEIADVPWVLAWAHLFRQDGAAAHSGLIDAYALMPALQIDTSSTPADVFVDGIYRDQTPASVRVFPSRFDVTLRSDTSGDLRERRVVAYSDGTPGGASPIHVKTAATSGFPPFGEEADVDRDWLGDSWERIYFGDLSPAPGDDPDGDGSINLYEYWNATSPSGGLCAHGASNLCLNQSRFNVTVSWRDFTGNTGSGQVVPIQSADSGLFYFFSENNWEMLVKVLRGCPVNNYYWVFAAATTNVEYTLTVTDMLTGDSTSYFNPLGNSAAAITDTQALATCSASAAPPSGGAAPPAWVPGSTVRNRRITVPDKTGCTDSGTDLCLNGERFRVEVSWRDFRGVTGSGQVAFGSADSGLFYFFDENNWEILVKILKGCALNGRYWVFAAATTNVEYTLTVTDTESGQVRTYENALGVAAPAITDTDAFRTCS
jgi:tetratricopeptide (TPR) repeat protein